MGGVRILRIKEGNSVMLITFRFCRNMANTEIALKLTKIWAMSTQHGVRFQHVAWSMGNTKSYRS